MQTDFFSVVQLHQRINWQTKYICSWHKVCIWHEVNILMNETQKFLFLMWQSYTALKKKTKNKLRLNAAVKRNGVFLDHIYKQWFYSNNVI